MIRLRRALLAGVALTALSCAGVPGIAEPEPASISIQAGDLPADLLRCPQSGAIEQFLANERGRDDVEYQQTQQAWRDMQAAGATDASEQVFADGRNHCAGLFGAQRINTARLAVSLVARFRSEAAAVGMFRKGISGYVEPDQLAGQPGVIVGAGSGLGDNAVAVAPGGQRIYLAAWQRGAFYLVLNTFGLEPAAGRRAAGAMLGRAG